LESENLTLDTPEVRKDAADNIINQRKQLVNAALLEVALREAKIENKLAESMLSGANTLSSLRPAGAAAPQQQGSPAAGSSPNASGSPASSATPGHAANTNAQPARPANMNAAPKPAANANAAPNRNATAPANVNR
jgi:hypothetical protein